MKIAVTPDVRQRAEGLFPPAEAAGLCAGLAAADRCEALVATRGC